jgi:hypothetical protein
MIFKILLLGEDHHHYSSLSISLTPSLSSSLTHHHSILYLYRFAPGIALGSDAIYIIGDNTATSAILKCPTTSIATADCTTYVQYNEEAFYTGSTYTTKATDSGGDNLILSDM